MGTSSIPAAVSQEVQPTTFVRQLAFWNDKGSWFSAMKIAKFVGTVFIPIAYLMDLINSAINYVWPKVEKVETPVEAPKKWYVRAKDATVSAASTACHHVGNHKKVYISSAVAVAALAVGIPNASAINTFLCGHVWKYPFCTKAVG